MKHFSLLFMAAFTCFLGNSNAQSPAWLWAKGIGGTTDDNASSVAVDASGNIYTTGYFYGPTDFDPGPGVFNLTGNGTFISKLDNSGNFVWAKAVGGGFVTDGGYSIAIDPTGSGAVYTTGRFEGTADFDPGTGVYYLSAGYIDIFISKLDLSGNFVWAIQMDGMGWQSGYSIAIDTAGNGDVYTTGGFDGTVDFDPGAGVFNLTGVANGDIFVSKLDSSGNFVWAKAMGGINSDVGLSIAIDPAGSGDVYTTGYFEVSVDFDPGAGTFILNSAGSYDIFISKLDSSGNFVWAKAISSTGLEKGFSIALDPAGGGAVYTTGFFGATVDFDPGTGVFNLTGGGVFISKLDGSGNFVWAKALGATGMSEGYSIVIDPAGSGDVYTTGSYAGTSDFDPGAGVFNLTSAGGEDIFVSKLNSSGNFVWAKAAGGIYNDKGLSLAADAAGHLTVAGYFISPSIPFASDTLTNAGYDDIFLARLDTLFITGINAIDHFTEGLFVFPNPVSDYLTISFENIQKNVEITIMDITGQLIYSTTTIETHNIEVNTESFAEGVYFAKIKAAGFIETKRFIVAK